MRLAEVLAAARARLAKAGIESADLDARLLVGEALGLDAAALFRDAEKAVPADGRAVIEARLARRLLGEPVHRILGRRAFYAHDFALSPETLEPRPDTEVLVELCRKPIAATIARTGGCILADVGTGTGAIAVSLLVLFPQARAIAIDIAAGALKTALGNAGAAGVGDRFRPHLGDHLAGLEEGVDLVVSNPPYIPSAEIAGLAREVRTFDPLLALDGGPDGLRSYRRIAAEAGRLLRLEGAVAVEIGIGQGRDVAAIFARHGFELVESSADLSGAERALLFRPAEGDTIEGDFEVTDEKALVGRPRTL